MQRRKKQNRCPLSAHVANGGNCCIACGKTFHANPRKPLISPVKARQILHDGKIRGHKLTAQQRAFFGARASGYPVRSNPGEFTIGAPLRLYYDRDQGNRQGLYYHDFKRGRVYTEEGGRITKKGEVSIR